MSASEHVFRAVETPLFWLGAVTAAWLSVCSVYRLLAGIKVWVLGNGRLVSPAKLGKWAVVTGATDGIAFRCLDILAHAENSIVESKYGVETKTITADFSSVNIYSHIEDELAGLEIGVLGKIQLSHLGQFGSISALLNIPCINRLLLANVCSVFSLMLPPSVTCCDFRKKGAILNISSASGMYPVPLLTVYSASKAFVDFFSRGLQAEYKSKGIIIQSVLPFFVATKLSKIRRATLDTPSPERYVAAELNTVGLQAQTNGYLPHALMGWVSTALLPASILSRHVMGVTLSQRARYLKKQKQG
uniref:Hydroxysteroid (17-beta) dehydrogenase 12b n=1 Tax=Hippocampus comes TaxID=109280 RepID=A0A3Q2Z6E3_HIPCM